MYALKTIVISALVYVFFFVLTMIIGFSVFPVNPTTGEWSAPGWYAVILLFLPALFVIGLNAYLKKKRRATILSDCYGDNSVNDCHVPHHTFCGEDNSDIMDGFNDKSIEESEIADILSSCDYDELLIQSANVILETGSASVSMLQRKLYLGYARAARIVDQLEELGIIGPFNGSIQREILVDEIDWDSVLSNKQAEKKPNKSEAKIDEYAIIQEEENWRRKQKGLNPIEYELSKIDSMDGHQFETWCSDLLSAVGFYNVSVIQGSGDQGVDVIAEKDGIKYAIQCKRYSSDLGNKPVQEVNTGKAIYNCHVGVVITNQHFTSSAKQAALATNTLLWDREKIIELLKLQR